MNTQALDRYSDIFVGDGEMARMMRQHDWASSSLGPPDQWPEALKVVTGSDKMDASAMLEYFAPLKTWLDEQNKQLAVEDAKLTKR